MFTNCDTDFTLYRNGIIIVNNSLQDLVPGIYNFTVIRTDQANYTNVHDEKDFTVLKAFDTCQIIFNDATSSSSNVTSPLTYPNTRFNVSTDCTTSYTLYRNGVVISNNSLQELTPGIYNFTVQRTDTQNYSIIGQERDFTINKASDSCRVLFNDTPIQNFPYIFKVFTNCDTSYTLYRDGVSIINNSDQNLSIGTYTFIVQRTDTQNYSNVFDSQIFELIEEQKGFITGGGGGTPEGWVVLNTVTTNITLYSMNTISGTNWYYDSDNIIEVETLDVNGNHVDVDNITIREINNQPFHYSVVRNDTGLYEIHYTVTDTNVKNLNFELTIKQGSKTLTKTIGFGSPLNQYISGLTGRAIALGDNIYNWSAQNMFFLFIVVAIFGIVIVLYFVIRVMIK